MSKNFFDIQAVYHSFVKDQGRICSDRTKLVCALVPFIIET